MGHYLVPWHFPVYIEPSALLITRTYRNTFFSFFLRTAFLLINNRPTDRQIDSTVTSYLREVVPSHIFYGIPRGDDGKLFRLEVQYYIHRRRAGAYYSYRRIVSYRRTASCRRTASQTDETVAEKLTVLDSKGNQIVPKQKDSGKDRIARLNVQAKEQQQETKRCGKKTQRVTYKRRQANQRANQITSTGGQKYRYLLPSMARTLKMQRRQAAKAAKD